MKKYLAAFMALAMAATALTGCGGGDSAGGDDSNKTYKVAYIARAQSDSFAAWLANEMVAAADKYDDIELKVFDGQADDAKENACNRKRNRKRHTMQSSYSPTTAKHRDPTLKKIVSGQVWLQSQPTPESTTSKVHPLSMLTLTIRQRLTLNWR